VGLSSLHAPYSTFVCTRGSLFYSLFHNLGSYSCVQMLKAIGVIKESKKGAEKPYQDSVTAPLDREDERDIDEKEDDGEDGDWEDEDEEAPSSAVLGKVLPAIGKVHAI
jgi:hypothetical protein